MKIGQIRIMFFILGSTRILLRRRLDQVSDRRADRQNVVPPRSDVRRRGRSLCGRRIFELEKVGRN